MNDSGPKRRITPAVTPIVRRNVEKAEDDEVETRLGEVNGTEMRTIDLVLHFLPITHEGSLDPIPRKHYPSNDAESVPTKVHQCSLGIPQTLPKVGFLKGIKEFGILD